MAVVTDEGARRRAVRRAAGLLVGSGLALAGLVVLLVLWIGVGAGSLREGAGEKDPCVAAAAAGTDDADIRYELLPPRSVCTWTVDGRTERRELAHAPGVLAGGAAAAVVVGLVTVGAAGVRGRRR